MVAGSSDVRSETWPSRPVRIDVPVRAANISDQEVREVRSAVAGVYPGAIVNIGTVVDKCPCEDGPACSAQVWVVVHRQGQSTGIMLSRIDYEWQVGPVQSWWPVYEKLLKRIRSALSEHSDEAFEEYFRLIEEQNALLEQAPKCHTDFQASLP